MQNFYLVKEYKELYDVFPSKKDFYKGFNIGIWCETQRNSYRTKLEYLTQERMELSNSIDFV